MQTARPGIRLLPAIHGSRARRRSARRGQSLVEFALLLPVLLTLVGACIDFARIYFAWVKIESATRDAVQWIASDPAHATTGGYYDSTDTANYCGGTYPCTVAPGRDAKTVLDAQTGSSFAIVSDQTSCSAAKVWGQIVSTPATDSAAGGSQSYPVATARVTACLPFRTLFAYPLFTTQGVWVLRVDRTMSTIVGR